MSNETQITDAAQARHLIETAQKHSVYNADMPVDDQGAVALANQLYSMAVQARDKGMDAVQINDVIAAGEGSIAPAPASAAPPAPVATPAPPAPPAKVKIRSAADGTVYEIDASQVDEYTIGGAYQLVEEAPTPPPAPAPVEPQPPVAAPEPTPEPAPAAAEQPAPAPAPAAAQPTAADPSEYQSVEPWEGYKKLNIKPIMAEIEQRMQSGDSNLNTLLFHVFEYEKANKGRERLLAKLKELAENGVAASATPAPAATPEPAPAPVPAAAPVAPPVATPAPVAQDPDVVPGSPFAGAVETTVPAASPAPAPVPAPVAAPAAQQAAGQALEAAVTHVQSGGATLVAPLEGATQKSIQAIVAERLPIPSEIDGDAPTLPADFTTLSDQEVARLQSQFNACLARANWLGAVADGHSNDAKIIADGKTREYKAANPAPKGTTVDQLEAQAYAAVPEIAAARTVQSEWGQHGRLLHALCNTFQSNCERLSREQTRRSDERATAK